MSKPRTIFRTLVACALIAGSSAFPARSLSVPSRSPCDPLDSTLCLLPFPNDRFTTPDATTATGKRVDFQLVEMPRGLGVNPIDPREWNRNDGFSPGSMVLTYVPLLNLHQTWGTENLTGPRVGGPNDPRDHVSDIGRYTAADAPILIIDATTGQRWPFWSELDMNAGTKDQHVLILRPAKNFLESHRYLVALRNLKDSQGGVIPAGPAFSAYLHHQKGIRNDPTFGEDRGDHIRSVINQIGAAETARGNAFDKEDLFLAWDFTVASRRNLTERVLHIRDDAFAQLGDTNLKDGVIQGASPKFHITKVTERTDGARVRQVEGTITVPNYLTLPPEPIPEEIGVPVDNPIGDSLPGQAIPGNRFFYGGKRLPQQNPVFKTIRVPFVCTIPKPNAAYDDGAAHPMLYGHGLLGSRFESTGGSTDRDRERNFMPCAVNWMGFAEYDIAGALITLLDPSNMPSMIDRAQQGFVNFLYLGRALAHPNGLARNAAFRDASGRPLFHTRELFYDGNSQGAIMGGALAALGVDFTRAVVGVAGMNYSTLLNRSSDWEGPLINTEDVLPSYSSFLYTMFPNKPEQQLVIAILQMLWDRGEADGYAQHMTTSPLPNTPAHRVLIHAALGDFQVTNHSVEVEARTIGARVMATALLPGRHWAITPFFGLTAMPSPWAGSGLVYWDSGNYLPPNANVPPLEDGGDPHEDPRRDPRGGDQKRTFWLTGEIIDVMNGGAYLLCRPGAESQIPRVPSLFNFDWCV